MPAEAKCSRAPCGRGRLREGGVTARRSELLALSPELPLCAGVVPPAARVAVRAASGTRARRRSRSARHCAVPGCVGGGIVSARSRLGDHRGDGTRISATSSSRWRSVMWRCSAVARRAGGACGGRRRSRCVTLASEGSSLPCARWPGARTILRRPRLRVGQGHCRVRLQRDYHGNERGALGASASGDRRARSIGASPSARHAAGRRTCAVSQARDASGQHVPRTLVRFHTRRAIPSCRPRSRVALAPGPRRDATSEGEPARPRSGAGAPGRDGGAPRGGIGASRSAR